MSNLKFFMAGVMVCAIVVAGGVVLTQKVFKEDKKEQNEVNASVTEYKASNIECKASIAID